MTRILHLVIGPREHGVIRHAELVATGCGHDIRAYERAADVDVPGGYDVVHVPFTEQLFGPGDPAEAFDEVAAAVRACGAVLSVTLHDVPQGSSPLQVRRRAVYRRVVAAARGVVVSSWAELAHAEALDSPGALTEGVRTRRVIPLPVGEAAALGAPAGRPEGWSGADVGVLGFVYPDRGYDAVLRALPEGVGLVAIGRAADRHAELPAELAGLARDLGRSWDVTGFVPDDQLAARLAGIAVPVAPNRHCMASASIATWLAHGRRPLVPVSPYTCELARARPDTLTLYDPDDPQALGAAIARARANPAGTWLPPGVQAGPSPCEVADEYGRHFAACAPPVAPRIGPGRVRVPGNRWDLLDDMRPTTAPTVSVVIPYFEAQRQLDLVLTGLAAQTHPLTRLQVIVADDGSARLPVVPADGPLDVTVVRQPDQGFRAAAARNLGAAGADGDVLVFLDGDTVPAPDFVRELVRLPALTGDALVVGRREHVDLSGWTGHRLQAWLTGSATPPPRLTDPAWLRDGYAWSRHLLDVDARSYRYVISAVLGISADLFRELDGFCAEFTGYGGEDWELAYRAYVAGGLLAHEPRALAWHDGPEWAERDGVADRSKEAESRRVAYWIPDGSSAVDERCSPYPMVVVRLEVGDPAVAVVAARSALDSGCDCGIWLHGPGAEEVADTVGHRRVVTGTVPPAVTARARVVVTAAAGRRPGPALARMSDLIEGTARYGLVRTPDLTAYDQRAVARARRWHADPSGLAVTALGLSGIDVTAPCSSAGSAPTAR